MRWALVFTTGLLFALNAFALDVGDEQPGLDGYTIDNSADYLGPWLDIETYLDDGKCVVACHWKQSWGSCRTDCLTLETDFYDVYKNEGVGLEVISYNGWDAPSVQSTMKYTYHGQYLEHDFMDAEQADWTAWKKTGSNYYGQTALVGPNGYVYFIDDYALDETGLTNAIESIIYGDDDPPYVDGLNPDDGETDVDLDEDIKGHVKDDNWGVDEESVVVEASVFSRDVIEGTLTLTGDFLDFTYKLNPDDDLPHYAEVSVYVAADDLARNEVEYEYSFWTRSFELEAPDDGEVFDVTGSRSGGETKRVATTGTVPVITDGGRRSDFDVTFEWEEVVRADSYELLVDDNDDFSSPEVHETGIADTEYTHTFDVTDDVTYYWYVVCNAPESDFDSADVFSFEFDYSDTNIDPASLGRVKAGFAE